MAVGSENPDEARQALATLCESYWYPLYAYVRRSGHSPHDAQDLTQAFFAKLLEKDYLLNIRREGGRFRSFLLTALKRFLANEWDRRNAQKRGGHLCRVSFDFALGETRYRDALGDSRTPEDIFAREWAHALLDHARRQVESHYRQHGQVG